MRILVKRMKKIAPLITLVIVVLCYFGLQFDTVSTKYKQGQAVKLAIKKGNQSKLIGTKIGKCFQSLSLDHLLTNTSFRIEAETNVRKVLMIFDGVATEPRDGDMPNSYCWTTEFNIRKHSNGQITGVLGSHIINTTIGSVVSDPRMYYHMKLKTKTNIAGKRIHHSLVCIPRVFLAGLPKSGTTAIDSLLTIHPLVTHGLSKEPRWWVPPNLTTPIDSQANFKPITEYLLKYLLQYSNDFDRIRNNKQIMLIDSSPNLFTSWFNIAETDDGNEKERLEDICLVPVAMSIILPYPKYIVVLRDPVDFLYSRFWFSCWSKVYRNVTLSDPTRGPAVFHSMVTRRIEIFKKCTKQYSTERCVFSQAYIEDKQPNDFNCGRVPLNFAIYYVHVIRWFSVFSPEDFYITTYDTFFKNPIPETLKLWNFLELPHYHVKSWRVWKERLSEGKNENKLYKKPGLEMLPQTETMLKNFFHPFNILLSKVLKNH